MELESSSGQLVLLYAVELPLSQRHGRNCKEVLSWMVHSKSHWFKPNTCCRRSAGKHSVPATNESRRWSALHSSIGSRGTAPHPAFCLLSLPVLTYWSSVINYSYSRFSLSTVWLSCQLSVHFAGHAVGLCWLFCGCMFWSCYQRLMLFCGRMFWSCYQPLLAVL